MLGYKPIKKRDWVYRIKGSIQGLLNNDGAIVLEKYFPIMSNEKALKLANQLIMDYAWIEIRGWDLEIENNAGSPIPDAYLALFNQNMFRGINFNAAILDVFNSSYEFWAGESSFLSLKIQLGVITNTATTAHVEMKLIFTLQ